MPFTAVLDTCVLVPAGLRDTLLRFAAADLFRPVWSDDILAELASALREVAGLTPRQFQRLTRELDAHFPGARAVGYHRYIPVLELKDPDDRHVLAAAIAARANAIVTDNVRHFPAAACEPVEVLRPDPFLVQRFDLDPEGALAALRAQAAALRSPAVSLEELLAKLEPRLPALVARARGALSDPT